MAPWLDKIRPHWLRRAVTLAAFLLLGLCIVALYAAGTLLVAFWAAIKALGEGPVEMISVLRTELIQPLRAAWRGSGQ